MLRWPKEESESALENLINRIDLIGKRYKDQKSVQIIKEDIRRDRQFEAMAG